MSMTLPLPSGLQRRLSGVGFRVRWLQTVRGLALLVAMLGVLAGTAMLVDYALGATLPAWVRAVNLGVWTSVGLTLLVRRVVRPAVQPVDLTALAALVEQHHPDLGERLTSSVELCQRADEGSGAPELIELLVRETERRTSGIHFGRAVTSRSTRLLTMLALAVAALLAVPAAVAPATSAHLAGRFFLPWLAVAAPADFTFAVEPGDTFAARGRLLTVRATLSPADAAIRLPETASLVVTGGDGSETRLDMASEPEQEGVYSATFRLAGDVTYRVEAGNATSDSFRATAVVPVELAADSPQVTVTPPAYAAGVLDAETYTGTVDFAALQHSTVEFRLAFTRPAVAAALVWQPVSEKKDAKSARVVPMQLGPDGTTASVTLPADATGSYRLLLDAEHGVRTEREGAIVTVKPDQPPALLKYVGREGAQATRPDDRLPLELRLADDIGVAAAHLLLQINDDKKVREEPFVLDGANTRSAIARHQLLLAGKVKDGDLVRYRVRFQDNLPPALGGPHVVFHPADGWLELRIRAGQKSVREQDVLARRDEINQKLDQIREDLKQEQRRVLSFRQLSDMQAKLSPRSLDILQGLTGQNQKVEQDLRDLSRSTADDPGLQELSRKTDDLANQEMRRAGQNLQDTRDPKTGTDARRGKLESTENELTSALKKLTELKALNDKLAADRLDQMKVETLADRQQGLAEKANELAGKHPVVDPEAKQLNEDLKREQDDVARQLRELTEKNPLLKQALEQARVEALRQAADRARELAQEQRDVAKASDQTEKARAGERLGDLARKQEALAKEADALARETASPAKANFARPLQTDDAAKATDSLERGDAERAMQEQDRSARELDRLSHDLDRALRLAGDPREAARQLSRLEDELSRRTREEAKRPDDRRLAELAREQEAVRQAAEKLSVPPDRKEARADQQKAVAELNAAQKALERKHANAAAAEMEKARQTLRDLANKLPSLDERRQKARAALQELMREQEAIARKVQESGQDPSKGEVKLNEASRRQGRVAEELARLDTPNQEERRDRVRENALQAMRDLADRRKDDQPASQAKVRREMERLAQALSGQKPADEKAAELADRQRALAARAEKAANDATTPPAKQEELKQEQRRVADEAGWLHTPEAPAAKREAADAARQAADEAARQAPTTKEARQAMEESARKLDALARTLAGEEKPSQQAQRLAQAQKQLADRTAREGDTPATQERQRDVGREAKEMRTPDAAKAEAERARQAVRKAEEAKPAERGAAQQKAAEALKDLADKLAKSPAGERPDTPAQTRKQAAQLAREQARLAEATRQTAEAAKQPGKASAEETKRALQTAEADQKRLNDQAAQMKPAPADGKALEQARAAMDQARQALEKKDAAGAAEKQQQAAQALQQMAGQPSPLPARDQVDRARALAREQRELREAVQRANQEEQTERRADNAPNRANPAGKLAQQQAEVARQTAQLARTVAGEQGERSKPAERAANASDAAKEATRNLQSGATQPAQQAGKRTAEELRRLADDLAKTPRGADSKGDTLQSARQLAQQQEELNRQLQPLAGDRAAERAQQQTRQGELAQQTADLARQLQQAGQSSGKAQSPARSAARNAESAANAMQAARNQAQQGQQSAAQAQREQAARSLDQLARQADQAAGRMQPGQPGAGEQAGQSVQQAQSQIGQAQNQLNQNQPGTARQSMAQAAQSLANAAQQLAQATQPGKPNSPSDPGERGVSEGGTVDTRPIPKELAPHAGKRWGELPGELRTRIVQQMKARYGDDYARMIKLYFEQLADTRRR